MLWPALLLAACAARAEERAATVLSPVYEIDRKYKSMSGPSETQPVRLAGEGPPRLLWITGYKAVITDERGSQGRREFMCHSNLDFDSATHRSALGLSDSPVRLFTLSQGQESLHFPPGFGVPVLSTETLKLTTQVLNLNYDSLRLKVRHKVTVFYVPDGEGAKPMIPLFATAAYGLKLLSGDDGAFGVDPRLPHSKAPSCLPGESAAPSGIHDDFGRRFTGHWVVKPGREINSTRVTAQMAVPYDTTLHVVLAHLHPFAESVELWDSTARKRLFKSRAVNAAHGIGLERVDGYSSPAGIPVYRSHEYELISVYNNTTSEDQDAMAVLNLFLRDKEFDARRFSSPAR